MFSIKFVLWQHQVLPLYIAADDDSVAIWLDMFTTKQQLNKKKNYE